MKSWLAGALAGLVAGALMGCGGDSLGVADDSLSLTVADNCPVGANLIMGGLTDDTIIGTDGVDCIFAGAGNDTISGRKGNDWIYGEAGDDVIDGEAGNDKIWGGDDNDTLRGGDGNDEVFGLHGNDHVYGGPGDDVVGGNEGDDFVYGEAGRDRLYGHSGDDQIFGAGSADRIWGGPGADLINAGDGEDDILGGDGPDTITTGAGTDRADGQADCDIVDGAPDADCVVCGDGTLEPPEQCELDADCAAGQVCTACACVDVALCGNGVLDPLAGEVCDPTAVPTGCAAGTTCTPDCLACAPVAMCGNGALDGGEECDPTAAPTGCAGGVVCLVDCTCDIALLCGNGILEAGEACDPPGGGCASGFTCSIGDGCVCVPSSTTNRPFAVLHAADDAGLVSVYDAAVSLIELPDALFTALLTTGPGVILDGSYTAVGLNPGANMNVSAFAAMRLGWDDLGAPEVGGTLDPSLGGTVGFRGRLDPALAFEEDVLSPGCLCEGHGVRADEDVVGALEGGFALSNNHLINGTVTQFAYAYDAAARAWIVRSVWNAGDLQVRMDSALRRDDMYLTQTIRLTNVSATNTIRNIRFNRSLDYDVPPGHFADDSFAFLYPFTPSVASVPQLIRSLDNDSPRAYGVATVSPQMVCANGITFMSTDPDVILAGDQNGSGILDCNEDPVSGSPGDRSSSFVFRTLDLAPGESASL
ncbi:MAG: hypothetical protein HY791_04325 [Deltaproteobacteria bacterium]|nr:hypothetical protein [Deltaproteobacteria bacterium]